MKNLQTYTPSSGDEQTVLRIMQELPADRMRELVDFARFLEFQTRQKENQDEEKEAEIEDTACLHEKKWEQLLAKPEAKRMLREMAYEALGENRTGQIRIRSSGIGSEHTMKMNACYHDESPNIL